MGDIPEIKFPDIRSLIDLITATPGSRGIIEPTINIVGVSIIPNSVKATPRTVITKDETTQENADIELIFIVWS